MLEGYEELWRWSVEEIESFWAEVWDWSKLKYSKSYNRVLPKDATIDQVPVWFEGARLNFTENLLLDRHQDDKPAILFANELGVDDRLALSWKDLRSQVAALSNAMRANGIRREDVVAIYCPNIPRAVIFALAAATIGAIVTAVSPDFGPHAVLDRLQQTRPKMMLVANAVRYNGKIHDQWEKTLNVLKECPSIQLVIHLDYIKDHPKPDSLPTSFKSYETFISGHDTSLIDYEQLPFNHPLFILYSSGTTGKPKCLVHSAGGTLLQHLKEHILHADLGPTDKLLQYTTVGWMMWQWQLTTLAVGCTLVLYDGSPFKPDDSHLLKVLQDTRVTAFGTSAKYLQRLEEAHIKYPVDSLRIIFSTGSPLPASTFEYIYNNIAPTQIASITGGTDIISLFAGGNPSLPVYSGLIQCRCLGMAVHAYNHNGESVHDEPGDLVCTRPFPSQPVFFWGDSPDRTLYRKAYFSSDYPTVWHHGDFIQIDRKTCGILMLGRSDGTLNPAGVRFGSADLYAVVSGPEFRGIISDALAVGVRKPGDPDERVVLFVQMAIGHIFDDNLRTRLSLAIRSELSPRHVPAFILPCPAIPVTLIPIAYITNYP